MAKQGSKLKLKFCDDGSVQIDGSGMIGSDAELRADLTEMAQDVGGDLKVEKHIERHSHSHTHSDHDHHKH